MNLLKVLYRFGRRHRCQSPKPVQGGLTFLGPPAQPVCWCSDPLLLGPDPAGEPRERTFQCPIPCPQCHPTRSSSIRWLLAIFGLLPNPKGYFILHLLCLQPEGWCPPLRLLFLALPYPMAGQAEGEEPLRKTLPPLPMSNTNRSRSLYTVLPRASSWRPLAWLPGSRALSSARCTPSSPQTTRLPWTSEDVPSPARGGRRGWKAGTGSACHWMAGTLSLPRRPRPRGG